MKQTLIEDMKLTLIMLNMIMLMEGTLTFQSTELHL